jgi:CheY-like chemotaxis protein
MMKKILVIEDDDLVLRLLKKMLGIEGYTIECASNGKEGVEKFRENPADLVITDLIMPEQDGIETIIQLKETAPDLKIIAISGGGQLGPGKVDARDYLDIAKSFGAFCILPKPIDRKELIKTVKQALLPEDSPPS